MKQLRVKLVLAGALLSGASVWAQGGVVETPGGPGGTSGCTNSPENPTALLAVAGVAGGIFSYGRARYRARKSK